MSAPYYYGELNKKDSSAASVIVLASNSSSIYPSSSSNSNGGNNIGPGAAGSAAVTGNDSGLARLLGSVDNPPHNQPQAHSHNQLVSTAAADELSPSTSLNSLSRPASSVRVPPANLATLNSHSHYGITNLNRVHHNSNTIGSFANPLLSIEPDTRNGSESLPRAFQNHAKKFFPTKSHKQGIYQRSLSIFANGVSPLLRKKKSKNGADHKENSNDADLLSHRQNLSASTLGLSRSRRKSEPIMFSYDSITNELSKFQAREEKILENIDLGLEKMLMNDTNGEYMSNASLKNVIMHSNDASLRQQLANMQYYRNKESHDPYGRTLHAQMNSQPQLSYKEPFYMVYEDNRTKHDNHDNIYEEIDFLTLSSLRAQYADTLSLQSYKKKGGSKRSLASSSFTRWFSTRKKNSPSMSEDENPYIDIKISKKQRPPITLPEAPKELSKEQLKRRYIVGSIVDSENSYINALQRIINCYKKPLEENSPTILSQNKINIIFHRLEQILQCHTIFGIALSQCVREWDEKEQIGDVFIASFSKSMVLDIYSDFINNFTNAMETARKATKSKSAFAQFLQEKSLSSPDRLSFFGLMVKPVQRFPQFILLLSDLLKHTPADHYDRMSLQLALTQLESLADRLNERKRDAERHFAVKQLLKDYLSTSTTNSSNRFLLRQDDVYQLDLDTSSGLVMKTKCRKLYLLNDMLVCVSVPANRLKFAVSLQDIDVMDDVTPATNNLIANSMLKSKGKCSKANTLGYT